MEPRSSVVFVEIRPRVSIMASIPVKAVRWVRVSLDAWVTPSQISVNICSSTQGEELGCKHCIISHCLVCSVSFSFLLTRRNEFSSPVRRKLCPGRMAILCPNSAFGGIRMEANVFVTVRGDSFIVRNFHVFWPREVSHTEVTRWEY
jgi:hypothetical protein